MVGACSAHRLNDRASNWREPTQLLRGCQEPYFTGESVTLNDLFSPLEFQQTVYLQRAPSMSQAPTRSNLPRLLHLSIAKYRELQLFSTRGEGPSLLDDRFISGSSLKIAGAGRQP